MITPNKMQPAEIKDDSWLAPLSFTLQIEKALYLLTYLMSSENAFRSTWNFIGFEYYVLYEIKIRHDSFPFVL